jgi:xeroderma pigmentosum group C-complementing protein
LEDAELQSKQIIEGMPTSIAGFKDHPMQVDPPAIVLLIIMFSYVLERHLLQNEVVYPAVEIGRFRGEVVFSRENVVSGLKTADNWMRRGRTIQEGAQPMKFVRVRASTISRRRMIESFGEIDGESEAVQGCMPMIIRLPVSYIILRLLLTRAAIMFFKKYLFTLNAVSG